VPFALDQIKSGCYEIAHEGGVSKMGIRRKELQPIEDPWVGADYIVRKYSVSETTGLRWIRKLAAKYLTYTDERFTKRGKRLLRRIPLSILEEHINEFLN